MPNDLHELLGLDPDDPDVRAVGEDDENFANLILALYHSRRNNGLTQKDVAARMGTTQSAVSDLERTAGDPYVSTLQRYARAVGMRLKLVAIVDNDRWEAAGTIPVSAKVVPSAHKSRLVRLEQIEELGA